MNFFFKMGVTYYCLLLIGTSLTAQSLDVADSLYEKQKYTEAFEIYHTLFESKQASPAMLIKMAYIREGLGDYVDALYYLHHYHQLTSDKKVLKKMQELAEEHDLSGYEYSDESYLVSTLIEYEHHLILGLTLLSILLLLGMHRVKKENGSPLPLALLQAFLVVTIALLANRWYIPDSAIITRNHTLLMNGPSAGAEPVEMVEKGHKVVLEKQDDVWSVIRWQEEKVYVRNSNLQRL